MLLTDYFRSDPDATWDYAKQSGVNHGVIRLPENKGFVDVFIFASIFINDILYKGDGVQPSPLCCVENICTHVNA